MPHERARRLRRAAATMSSENRVLRHREIPPRGRPRGAQRGAALLLVLLLLVVAIAAVLLGHRQGRSPWRGRSVELGETRAALAEARAALIGWSVTHPDQPGRLPFPDRRADVPGYDGISDCPFAGLTPPLLIGLLPTQSEGGVASGGICAGSTVRRFDLGTPPVATEPLVYAVSANLVTGEGLINPGLLDNPTHPWLTVRDRSGAVVSNRVAAVVIAPGPPLPGQERDPSVDPNPTIDNYLDAVTIGAITFNNADFSGCLDDAEGCAGPAFAEDFIDYPNSDDTPAAGDSFNDVIAYITADELLRHVEGRVLAEAAVWLGALADGDGDGVPDRAYPWLSIYEDPRSVRGAATGGSATSLTDTVVGDFAAAGVAVGDVVVNVTDDGRGTVSAVAGDTVNVAGGMTGGASFDAGDEYVVRPPFRASWGTGEGHLPVLDLELEETFTFATPFTLAWQGAAVTTIPPAVPVPIVDPVAPAGPGVELTFEPAEKAKLQAGLDAEYALMPPNPLSTALPTGPAVPGEARCVWTTTSAGPPFGPQIADCSWDPPVDVLAVTFAPCEGDEVADCDVSGLPDVSLQRRLSVRVQYDGTPSLSATGDLLARDVAVDAGSVAQVGFVRMTYFFEYNGNEYEVAEIRLDAPAGGASNLVTRGIRLDPVDWDETDAGDDPPAVLDAFAVPDTYPEWFVENEWRNYVYARVSPDHRSGGLLNCLGTGNCVLVDVAATAGAPGVTPARSDAEAALVSAGPALGALAQDRTTAGAGQVDDYFEAGGAVLPVTGNDTPGNGRVRREPRSLVGATAFNDQTRVVWPPCPAGQPCRP